MFLLYFVMVFSCTLANLFANPFVGFRVPSIKEINSLCKQLISTLCQPVELCIVFCSIRHRRVHGWPLAISYLERKKLKKRLSVWLVILLYEINLFTLLFSYRHRSFFAFFCSCRCFFYFIFWSNFFRCLQCYYQNVGLDLPPTHFLGLSLCVCVCVLALND